MSVSVYGRGSGRVSLLNWVCHDVMPHLNNLSSFTIWVDDYGVLIGGGNLDRAKDW